MKPAVRIRRSSWSTIQAELNRVAPAEGLAVPLVHLSRRQADADPCAPLSLVDLDGILIADVVLVPAGLQHNLPYRVRVQAHTDQRVNRKLQARLDRHPRLRACAYLHSHPFARGDTWPSGGDLHGHLWPLLERNTQAGLELSLTFLACRDSGAQGWKLQAFSLSRDGVTRNLGFARPVMDDSPAVRAALRGPLHARAAFLKLMFRFRQALRLRRLVYRTEELFGGWLRTVVCPGSAHSAAALMPIDYPARPIRFYAVAGKRCLSLPLSAAGPARLGPEGWAELLDWASRRNHGFA